MSRVFSPILPVVIQPPKPKSEETVGHANFTQRKKKVPPPFSNISESSSDEENNQPTIAEQLLEKERLKRELDRMQRFINRLTELQNSTSLTDIFVRINRFVQVKKNYADMLHWFIDRL